MIVCGRIYGIREASVTKDPKSSINSSLSVRVVSIPVLASDICSVVVVVVVVVVVIIAC